MNDPSIVVTQADKGNAVTILNHVDYINGALAHQDEATYILIRKDVAFSILRKFNYLGIE